MLHIYYKTSFDLVHLLHSFLLLLNLQNSPRTILFFRTAPFNVIYHMNPRTEIMHKSFMIHTFYYHRFRIEMFAFLMKEITLLNKSNIAVRKLSILKYRKSVSFRTIPITACVFFAFFNKKNKISIRFHPNKYPSVNYFLSKFWVYSQLLLG